MTGAPLTLINVFTVDPANQEELVGLLSQATETSVRHAPGFISAKLHRSLERTRVSLCAYLDLVAFR
jgi:quinol monooxygenase YgiN